MSFKSGTRPGNQGWRQAPTTTNAPSNIDKQRIAAQDQLKEFVASAQVNRFEQVAGSHSFLRRPDVLPQEANAVSDTFLKTHFSPAGFNPFG